MSARWINHLVICKLLLFISGGILCSVTYLVSHINNNYRVFFVYILSWYIFLIIFFKTVFVLIFEVGFCRQPIVGSSFLITSDSLWILIELFRPFTFNVNIDMIGFINVYHCVCVLLYLLSHMLFVLLLFLSAVWVALSIFKSFIFHFLWDHPL